MHLRRADGPDIDLVTELRLAFLADHRGVDPATFDDRFVERTRGFIADQFGSGSLLTWLAIGDHDAATPVGIVSMLLRAVPPRPEDPGTTEGYVINLYVPAPHRRHGIGHLLFDACIEHARRSGYRRLVLHFTDAGRPMYEQAGFAPDERWLQLVV